MKLTAGVAASQVKEFMSMNRNAGEESGLANIAAQMSTQQGFPAAAAARQPEQRMASLIFPLKWFTRFP